MTPLHVGEVQNWIDMGRLQVPEGRILTMKVCVCRGHVCMWMACPSDLDGTVHVWTD